MTFNSDEVNFLVYRYLEESGFHHSAYMFGYESSVLNAGIETTPVPRGALMSLLQKGILFAEAELFSLLTDGELDSKFEKTIGTMSLIECCYSAKVRAYERKVRDESSRTCSPHPGTSASVTANPTPQPPNSATTGISGGGSMVSTAPTGTGAGKDSSTGGGNSFMNTSDSMSHMSNPTTMKTGSTPTTNASELPPPPTSSNGSPFGGGGAKSLHNQQQQRERDFRAKQTPASVSQSSAGGGSGPPPRGVYRTGLSSSAAAAAAVEAAAKAHPHSQPSFPTPPITTAAMQYHSTLQFLQPQQLNHLPTQQQQQQQDLPVTSAGFAAFTGTALDNGLSQVVAAQQQYLKAGGQLQSKLAAENVDNFLSPALHHHQQQQQQQARFLVTNGSYQSSGTTAAATATIGGKRAGAGAGLEQAGAAAAVLNTGSTGSVYDFPNYQK